ncbi:Eco57I restriction-modification methylase domain-containing protein [Dictyobacter arantiisoli]|uniref:site-specific DNA-methyltransferase (adenine-specific) n=1 Tax=Dictyobacter arantiisoli TaxID=2014874 RepID=A0A5A5T7L2_9CHLR|nr:DNA methyltransferase [Dictyobacter arantiisoli]GCF07397.1 hypothetical protein KDI_09610 [Dictyobacter arantiisoli]
MTRSSHTHYFPFSAEQQSKRFYHHYKSEHSLLLSQFHGATEGADYYAYTTLLLSRLIFLFFLQARGWLDNDKHYLSHHLQSMQQSLDPNCFYRECLLPLFCALYEGNKLIEDQSSPLGSLPMLALPLFQPVALELRHPQLVLSNTTFRHLFVLLDSQQWQLDTQTLPGQDTLQPSVLAYIFEHQSDQKQTGTYYTQEDIATYIANATILPRLFAMVAEELLDAPDMHASYWHLLSDNPDRYIHAALRQETYLPEETAREYTLRQRRYHTLLAQLQSGSVHCIADFITYNLDLQRFTLDILMTSQQLDFLLIFFKMLERITVLDPTCGSGAFLVAAMEILRSLYMLCIERIEIFLAEASLPAMTTMSEHEISSQQRQANHQQNVANETQLACQAMIARINRYVTRQYFILHTIITHNLYGVDLSAEAIIHCQLRLYMALLASVEYSKDILPFSHLHFNIYEGNALVRTAEQAQATSEEQALFQWQHTFTAVFQKGGFDVIIGNPPYLEYSKIKQIYLIQGYEEKSCGNIYAAIVERSLTLCQDNTGYLGLIVPISLCSSQRFEPLRQQLLNATSQLWLANFEIFPSRLFEGAFQRISIILAQHRAPNPQKQPSKHALYVTRTHRWYSAERIHLLPLLYYTQIQAVMHAPFVFPKVAAPCQETLLLKLVHNPEQTNIGNVIARQPTAHFIYYQEATNYWTKAICHVPFYKKNGVIMPPPHGRFLFLHDQQTAQTLMALLNSSLFYVWFTTYSDGFHLSHALVKNFPLPIDLLHSVELSQLAIQLESDMLRHARISTRNRKEKAQTGIEPGHQIEITEYHIHYSKAILDQIDEILARYYTFTQEELDFIIHYDSKHRIERQQRREQSCNK